MQIKLLRNLGDGWPGRWKEGEIHEAEADVARKLLGKGFAVEIAPEPPPPEPEAVKVDVEPASGKGKRKQKAKDVEPPVPEPVVDVATPVVEAKPWQWTPAKEDKPNE